MDKRYRAHALLQHWGRPSPHANSFVVYLNGTIVADAGERRRKTDAYPDGGTFHFPEGRTRLHVEKPALLAQPTEKGAALKLFGGTRMAQTRLAITVERKPRSTTARLTGRIVVVPLPDFERELADALRGIDVPARDLKDVIIDLRERVANVK